MRALASEKRTEQIRFTETLSGTIGTYQETEGALKPLDLKETRREPLHTGGWIIHFKSGPNATVGVESLASNMQVLIEVKRAHPFAKEGSIKISVKTAESDDAAKAIGSKVRDGIKEALKFIGKLRVDVPPSSEGL